jgi:hypothetical protein
MSYSPPEPSLLLQTSPTYSPAYYGLLKSANTVGYFCLVYLTWRFLTHHLDWQLSTGCVIFSGSWLGLTRIKVDHLLQTYFDVLSRIELQLPIALGLILSMVALAAKAYHPLFHVAALAEMAGWIYIYILYGRNRKKFKQQGYGPVPLHTWVNPPASVLRGGDLILTSGNIAKDLHESVGHAEMVLKLPDGTLSLFSSYMAKGTIIHQLEELTGPSYKGHYVALHLRKPWSEKQESEATQKAEQMVLSNRQWAAAENVRVSRRIDFIPLPESLKLPLRKIFHASGYDWFGTFMGRVTDDRWTCIGAAVELYKRMGVKTNKYGTGLLGVGTTLLDPIMPVRFLSDPAFELITTNELELAPVSKNTIKRL